MRIISKYDDVYDLQHALFDSDRVWVREEETVQVRVNAETEDLIKVFSVTDIVESYSWGTHNKLYAYPVMVAGSLYWLYQISAWRNGKCEVFETFSKDALADKLLVELEMDVYDGFGSSRVQGLDQMFQKLKEVEQKALQFLTSFNKPLAMVTKITKSEVDSTSYFEVVTNFNFFKRKLAWQEIDANLYRFHQMIESYIWGVIGNGEKQVIETSDLDRLKAYGFDEKISFRTRKGE